MLSESAKHSYAHILKDLKVTKEAVLEVMTLLSENPDTMVAFRNEKIPKEEVKGLIKKHFPKELTDFSELLYDNEQIQHLYAILEEYLHDRYSSSSVLTATLVYVNKPEKKDLEKTKESLRKKYHADEVILKLRYDPEIINGYVLQVNDDIYDKSGKNSLKELKNKLLSSGFHDDLMSVIRSEIKDFDAKLSIEEGGMIKTLCDGIVHIEGMTHAMYGEIVEFENGVKGLVQNVEKRSIGCILLGPDDGLHEGSRVVRTKKRAGIGVGDALLGRVVDALGVPIDGKGSIKVLEQYPIEKIAPGVIERKSVTVPLETGILAIDSMFPIGRGQRELIIGDRQTGKTSIAVDTIINQRGKDVVCVYVAIGQKASTVSNVVTNLDKHQALDYTIVVTATASDYAPLQYLAPYSGTAIAEYFMDKGKDVLIIYDDLSKHAVAYRAISLLLKRPPGREAYPGDVFYLHSRLLERSCRLNEENGGGSITALPIIETLAGDVSAYIPTNVISITDGQIFLETDLFNAGNRPAVNVGLSVSRVGGAAQTKAMKKVSGTLRIELAQYKEMETFTQFSSDLDEDTRNLLKHGAALMELLKQPLYNPQPMYKQVLSLCLVTKGYIDDIPLKEIRFYVDDFINYIKVSHPEIRKEIKNTGLLSDELMEKICKYAKRHKEKYLIKQNELADDK